MTSSAPGGPIRVAMWSGPRNISTAMMRSFGSRADCAVTDEPFYGAFLKDTRIPQPMADEVIASMDCDWRSVARTMRGPVPGGKPIWYQKHMPHQMVGPVSIMDFPEHRHAFLIRDPARVAASYAVKRVTITADDIGYERQLQYVEHVADKIGKPPIVLDSADILQDPEAYLRALCLGLDIPWDPAMLHWEPGGRESDGIWASHWYNRVIATTGFGKPEGELPALGDAEQRVADEVRPFYERIAAYKIRL